MAILGQAETRILVQGITGREAATFTLESVRYGARIVAGVTPGKGGQHVHGVPVYDTVARAISEHPCEAAIVSVPAAVVREAALETLAHGLQLLVIVTERIPQSDGVAILEHARAVGARVIGPNSLGMISPERTRIGMAGGDARAVRQVYSRGPVGVISRSGGMMTEIANLLTQNGIGQSTCVSIGGDPIIGTTFVDLLTLYEADDETQALVLFCEPGGTMEEKLAAHLAAHGSRLHIVAFVAGRFADHMTGIRFGHAGAIVDGHHGSPARKITILREAGVQVADRFHEIPRLIQSGLQPKT